VDTPNGLTTTALGGPSPSGAGVSGCIALFDFDGTLTTANTLRDFTVRLVGLRAYLLGLVRLVPTLVRFKTGRMSHHEAKTRFVETYYRKRSTASLTEIAVAYCRDRLPTLLDPEAYARARWHQDQGHQVVIVSASLSLWLKPWCDTEGFDLIATEPEVDDDAITGSLRNGNCYGEHKVELILERYDLGNYQRVFAYGDSPSDYPMLRLAHEGYYCRRRPWQSIEGPVALSHGNR
jgi:HAD superfamily hydrolase (TIGR01490 family)